MYIEETASGKISFPLYWWDLGKDRFVPGTIQAGVDRMFDNLLHITALSDSYKMQFAGSHYGDAVYRKSISEKFYYSQYGPDLYEDGLERTAVDYSIFTDNYLEFLTAVLDYLSIDSKVKRKDDPPPGSTAAANAAADAEIASCSITIPDDAYSNVSISEHAYTVDGQVALLNSKSTRNISLTTELPNFDFSLINQKDVGPHRRVYNLTESGRGSMSLFTNLVAQYFISNFSPMHLCMLVTLSGFEKNQKKINETLAKLGYPGITWSGALLEIRRNSQVVMWVSQIIKRQFFHNLPPNAYEKLLGPNFAAEVNADLALLNYVTSVNQAKANIPSEVILEYRLMKFSEQLFTPSEDSTIASTSNTQSYVLSENGSLSKLDQSYKVIQTEQLYKVQRLIKRKIVVKRGRVKDMHIRSEGDRIIFEQLPTPIDPNNADPGAPSGDSISSTNAIYKTSNIPTMSWDDCIQISRYLPDTVNSVSESYRYRIRESEDAISEVVNSFISMISDEKIQTVSIDYDALSLGGTYTVGYVLCTNSEGNSINTPTIPPVTPIPLLPGVIG